MNEILHRIGSLERPLFFIGSDKNAGKTTAMMKISSLLKNINIAYLTTGRDGESGDVVFGNKKPSVYVNKGDLFATTERGLFLTDAVLLSSMGIKTSGNVERIGVWRALAPGKIELRGGVTAQQIWEIITELKKFHKGLIFIDGAMDRWAALSLFPASFVLVLGAASFDSVEGGVLWLKRKMELINLPLERDHENLLHVNLNQLSQKVKLPEKVWFDGALTKSVYEELKRRGVTEIAVNSLTHVFLQSLMLKECKLSLLSKPQFVGVVVNPFSPTGRSVNSSEIVAALKSAFPTVPIMDILSLSE